MPRRVSTFFNGHFLLRFALLMAQSDRLNLLETRTNEYMYDVYVDVPV